VTLNSMVTTSQYTPQGDVYLHSVVQNCSGELIPPINLTTAHQQQAWIAARIDRIRQAMAYDRQDCGMLNNNGTKTKDFFYEALSVRGNKLVQPLSFGFKDNAEGVSIRTFSFSVASDYKPVGATSLYDYQESITWEGDTGPEYAFNELDSGVADIQQVKERTIQTITQSGTAIGINQIPYYPAQKYNLPNGAKPVVQFGPNRRTGKGLVLYPVSWRYVMISNINRFN